jgi:hypothetical protein
MPIRVNCSCGKAFQVKDELAGKRVKCPACQKVLTAPAANDLEEEPKAPPKQAPAAAPRSNKTLFLIGGAIGVLLLGCCVCGGGGLGAWYFWPVGGSEKDLIGEWMTDVAATRDANPGGKLDLQDNDFTLDIKDKTMFRKYPGVMHGSGWTVISRDGSTVVVEVRTGPNPEQMRITIVNRNQLRVTSEHTIPRVIVYKRK